MLTWSRGRPKRCKVAFLAGLTLSAAFPGPWARAAEYPTTALAVSLGMAPELADETSLLFRMPQYAGLSASQLFALDNKPYGPSIIDGFPVTNSASFGVVGQTEGHGFFLLAQPIVFLGGRTFLQAGWGGAGEVWRLGAAARGGHDETEYRNDQEYGLSSTYHSESWRRRALWEGSVGLGVGRDGPRFDVVVDARWPREESESFAWTSLPAESSSTHYEARDDVSYEVAGRLRVPWGDGGEIVAVGSWGKMEQELEGMVTREDGEVQSLHTRQLERWSGGLAVSFAMPTLDWMALSLYWRHEETPGNSSEGFYTTKMEQIALSASLRERLWRELEGRAGINVQYLETGSESFGLDRRSTSQGWSQREEVRAGFSWGVSYRWRRFDARAALQETLNLGNLFFTLDVLVRL